MTDQPQTPFQPRYEGDSRDHQLCDTGCTQYVGSIMMFGAHLLEAHNIEIQPGEQGSPQKSWDFLHQLHHRAHAAEEQWPEPSVHSLLSQYQERQEAAEAEPSYHVGDTVEVAGTTFTKHSEDPFGAATPARSEPLNPLGITIPLLPDGSTDWPAFAAELLEEGRGQALPEPLRIAATVKNAEIDKLRHAIGLAIRELEPRSNHYSVQRALSILDAAL